MFDVISLVIYERSTDVRRLKFVTYTNNVSNRVHWHSHLCDNPLFCKFLDHPSYLEFFRGCRGEVQPQMCPWLNRSSPISGRLTFDREDSFQDNLDVTEGKRPRGRCHSGISPVCQRCGPWWPDQHT